MGKKKGRQTRDFKSKAERGGFRQAISHAAETARAEERAAAEYSRRETAAAHARPRLKAFNAEIATKNKEHEAEVSRLVRSNPRPTGVKGRG